MKYLPLIWAGLWRKRARAILTLLSIAVAFILFGVLAGVNAAFYHILETSHLDRLLVTSQVDIPIADANQIERLPGVSVVAIRKVLVGYFQDKKNAVFPLGVDARFFAVRPELALSKEQLQTLRRTRTGAVVSQPLADKYGWKVGDEVPINTNTAQSNGNVVWTFDIVAIIDDVDRPQSQWFLTNYEYVDQGRASGKGTIDAMLVRITDPARATQMSRAIDQLFANSAAPTRTFSERTATQAGVQSLGDVSFFTTAIVAAVLFMLLFVTGNTMMQSVRERTCEFATLKTLGFADLALLGLVLSESVLLCASAAVLGLLASRALIPLMHSSPYAFLLLNIPWTAVARGLGFAAAVALASALIPAWHVKQLTIIDALAGR